MTETHDQSARDVCPSPIDLAAYADGRGFNAIDGDEATLALEAHVSRCAMCMRLLEDLAVEAPLIESESRMLIVPSATLQAAMSLREGEASTRLSRHALRDQRWWIIGLRRGLAAAAAVAIMLGGYQIGRSFSASAATSGSATMVAAGSDNAAFGIFSSPAPDDSNDLFAIALTGIGGTKEVTP